MLGHHVQLWNLAEITESVHRGTLVEGDHAHGLTGRREGQKHPVATSILEQGSGCRTKGVGPISVLPRIIELGQQPEEQRCDEVAVLHRSPADENRFPWHRLSSG